MYGRGGACLEGDPVVAGRHLEVSGLAGPLDELGGTRQVTGKVWANLAGTMKDQCGELYLSPRGLTPSVTAIHTSPKWSTHNSYFFVIRSLVQ